MATVSLNEAVRQGMEYHRAGQLQQAQEIYQQILEQHPAHAKTLHLMGMLAGQLGQLDTAADLIQRALSIDPHMVDASGDLGNVFFCQGNVSAAIDTYRKALALAPDRAYIHSNLLYTLYFHPAMDASVIFAEHQKWRTMHAAALEAAADTPHAAPCADRRLRIGYVSPHLREHAIARFLLPLLSAHDRAQFEIFCYTTGTVSDAITQRLQNQSEHWQSLVAMNDHAAAETIRRDRIDILFDLAMHMDGCRPLIFARKPAPVQVAYLAYCGTTGLQTMDFRLSDPHLDPAEPSPSQPIYSEETIRLPETYWCYEPMPDTPEVQSPSSADPSTPITFGCLNNFAKVSDAALNLWGDILREIAESRLLLHAHPGEHRQRALRLLQAKGVQPDRVEFVPMLPATDYLRLHHRIDIALDPFPYSGGTTTCDALYVGVPVVTLAGQTAVGRGGVSILSNLGLPELIAHSESEYAQIAIRLARDAGRRITLRQTLRARMQASPLMDAPRFARAVEAAYREMWRKKNPPRF